VSLRDLFRRKPWLWVVVLMAFFLLLNLIMLAVAVRNAPTPVS
jgi:hypothetical protein